jgi:predicted ATPase
LILKGDLLLASSSNHAVEAEALYQNAVNIAQEGYAPMLELRAAIRLSRLWLQQGKKEQARKLLSAVYSKFTEGFKTADLKEASALLEQM